MEYITIIWVMLGGSLLGGAALGELYRAGRTEPVGPAGQFRLLADAMSRHAPRCVAILTVFAFLSYFGLGLYKLYALQMGNWDFGIYDSMLHNAATGQGFMLDYRGKFDHFSPVMMLFTPLYMIWDFGEWLVLIQAAALAGAAPLLYLTAGRYFRTGPVPLLLTAMYLFNPYFGRLALYDFHAECLYPLWLFAAFYCYSRNRFALFLLLMGLTPLIKEDFVVPMAGCGLWLASGRERRLAGILLFLLAVVWTLFVLKVYYPFILRTDYWHYGRYELLAPTLAETWDNWTTLLSRMFKPGAFSVIISVLVAFALLPLANWRFLLLFWLPTIGVQMVSANEHQQFLVSHYASALVGVTPLAALWGARTLRCERKRLRLVRGRDLGRWMPAGIAAAALLMLANHVVFSDLPLSRYQNNIVWHPPTWGGVLSLPLRPMYWREMARRLRHANEFKEIADSLPMPPGVTMICQNEAGVYFLRRATVYDFPELGLGSHRPWEADYFILDQGNYIGNADLNNVNYLLYNLNMDPEYRMLRFPNGILIFGRETLWR